MHHKVIDCAEPWWSLLIPDSLPAFNFKISLWCLSGSALPLPERRHNYDVLVEFLLFLYCVWGEALMLCVIRGRNSSVGRASVSIPPPCAHINVCAHVKNSKRWQPYSCLDAQKCCTRCQEWVGLPLVAAVPYLGKTTWISRKGQSTIYKKSIKMAISG